MNVRVLIADDHSLVRQGLRSVLGAEEDIEVVGEAANGGDAVTLCADLKPDVLLLDMRMPDMTGVEVCRRVKEADGDVRVLILTSFDEDDEVSGALLAGASGYVLKDMSPEAVVQALRGVAEGNTILDPSVAQRVFDGRLGHAEPDGPLSPRENEVLQLMAGGMRNKEIARALWISEPTVKSHVSRILQKLGAADRTQAILAGIRCGIVKAPEREQRPGATA